jgi:hypothetical protein
MTGLGNFGGSLPLRRRLPRGDRAGHAEPVAAWGYESSFVSARDPAGQRALWIRHTRYRPRRGRPSAALWCTVAGPGLSEPLTVIKQVFTGPPADAVAGPERFIGEAAMSGQAASWDLAVTSGEPPLRHLRPAVLYRAPLPRTKLESAVPHGTVSGVVQVGGSTITVSGWPGTVGRNWGSEHADSWVWLHADGLGESPGDWLELVLARVRAGAALLPWTAFGTLSLGGQRYPLGGLGRPAAVGAGPARLTATVCAPGARLELTVTADPGEAAVLTYADPAGGTRVVSHSALADAELTLRRPDLSRDVAARLCAYEYGTAHAAPGVEPRPLPPG